MYAYAHASQQKPLRPGFDLSPRHEPTALRQGVALLRQTLLKLVDTVADDSFLNANPVAADLDEKFGVVDEGRGRKMDARSAFTIYIYSVRVWIFTRGLGGDVGVFFGVICW